MQRVEQLTLQTVGEKIDSGTCERAISALESGCVLLLPRLPFVLTETEQQFLTPQAANGKSKNISYDLRTNLVRGDTYQGETHQLLQAMMRRFAMQSCALVSHLFPHYAEHVQAARTSYRPVQVTNRENLSYRKDDRRLHVDAFPSSPNQGRRILRVFSNVHPEGVSRVWRLGDTFENVAKHFLPTVHRPFPLKKHFLKLARITKTLRTDYDAYMLQIHDHMKADTFYQENTPQETVHLPAGATWIVFTDQASHAAMSGQFCLEQTFHLAVEHLKYPERSPLRVLEKLAGRSLT